MSALLKATLAVALVAGLVPVAASAQPRHKVYRHAAGGHVHGRVRHDARRHVYRGYARAGGPAYADPYAGYAGDPDDPYNPYAPPGAAIRAQARINQYAPGVTNELAPGNIATATGGPSGGVPGFSGR